MYKIVTAVLLLASSSSAATISPTWELSRGGSHEVWTEGDVLELHGWGSTNEGWPSHEVTWHFTVSEPRRIILDYSLGGWGIDYTVIEGNPSSVPVAHIAGLFDGHWIGNSPNSYIERLDESGHFSTVVPAGSYIVRGDLFGERIGSTWQLQAINVPEPDTMQMVYGVGIGFLAYLLIRFAFPPEGGYRSWSDSRSMRKAIKEAKKAIKGVPPEAMRRTEYLADSYVIDLQKNEDFCNGICPVCNDEQLVHTGMMPIESNSVLSKRYACRNCGTAFAARFKLESVGRIAEVEIEIKEDQSC